MPEDATPFAKLLLDYMWQQRPPLNISGLARQAGVSKQTVSNWLNGRTVPQAGTLALLAQKTGIPIEEIHKSLGAEPTPQGPLNFWEYIVQRVKSSTEYSDVERARLMDILTRYRREYELAQLSYVVNGKPPEKDWSPSSLVERVMPDDGDDRGGHDDQTRRIAERHEQYTA